jgi:hypothetical protein
MRQKDRLKIYESFFHKINMATLIFNNSKIAEAVNLIDRWSYAHRVGNGELTPREQQAIVDRVVKRMEEF